MTSWQIALWGISGLAVLTALYGLHRFCLKLEERGWLYYKHKKPTSSLMSSFVALQQFIEPPVRYVHHVKEQKRHHSEEEAAGQKGETDEDEIPKSD